MRLRDPCRFGVAVAPMPGESAMSLLLRAFQANGAEYQTAMRSMRLDRRNAIGESDIAALAWMLRADVDDVRRGLVMLEWRGGGRWVHLAGSRLSRWIAPTCMTAKVCPLCLRDLGFAKIAWMTRAMPACGVHGYSLLQQCGSCGRPVRWARPALRICQCGRFYKAASEVASLEPELQTWLKWAEAVLHGDTPTGQSALKALPPLVQGLSLDGAYRLIEAFGLLAGSGDPVRTVRHSSASLAEIGAMLVRGLRRLSKVESADQMDPLLFEVVHLPVLTELMEAPATAADGLRAAWLLDVHRAARPSGVRRCGSRPRRQLPLFL